MTKKAVTKKETTALVAHDYGEHAGKGFQNQTQEDIAIPFLSLLQSMSPQVKKKEDSYVEGAEEGMLLNTVTNELMEGVEFVPAITQHLFVEWVPRDKGGGIVGQHEAKSDVVRAAKAASTEFGKYKHGENDLVETFYVYGVVIEDGVPTGMAVLAMSSTKISVYKKVMTRLNTFQLPLGDGRRVNPPLFAHKLHISSTLEKRPKGSSFNFKIQPAVDNDVQKSLLAPDDPAFLMAAELEQLIDSGRGRAATESMGGGEGGDGDDMPF